MSLWAGQDNASDSVGSVIILAVAKEAPLLPQGGPGAATGEDILTAGEPSYDMMRRWLERIQNYDIAEDIRDDVEVVEADVYIDPTLFW